MCKYTHLSKLTDKSANTYFFNISNTVLNDRYKERSTLDR